MQNIFRPFFLLNLFGNATHGLVAIFCLYSPTIYMVYGFVCVEFVSKKIGRAAFLLNAYF